MVFRLLGQVVRRGWPLLLAAWGMFLLATWLAAPPWDEFAQDKEFAFLPPDAPSRRAAEVYAKAFPEDQSASNIVIDQAIVLQVGGDVPEVVGPG